MAERGTAKAALHPYSGVSNLPRLWAGMPPGGPPAALVPAELIELEAFGPNCALAM